MYSYPYPYPHPWSYPYPRFRNAVMLDVQAASTFLSTLNETHSSISFTMKLEGNGKLPFLGMVMIRNSTQLDRKVNTAKLQFHSLPFMGKDIMPSDTAKDLGVILDSNLTYDEHIIKTASSCMSCLGQINRVKHVFDKRTLLTIINSLVFSKLFYCSNVWANTSKCNLNKLQAVQNFACRIVSGARKYDHITPIRKELNWLPVANQLYYRSAIMAFKCMTGHAPEYLSSKFLKRAEVSGRSTRNSQLLNIPLFKTASGQRTFYYRIVNLWNSLDYSLKLCDSVTVFKNHLRTKLLKEL